MRFQCEEVSVIRVRFSDSTIFVTKISRHSLFELIVPTNDDVDYQCRANFFNRWSLVFVITHMYSLFIPLLCPGFLDST